jgi:hypothetical protein
VSWLVAGAAGVETAAVVGDQQLHPVLVASHGHRDAAGARVAGDVDQCLLRDAEDQRGDLGARVQVLGHLDACLDTVRQQPGDQVAECRRQGRAGEVRRVDLDQQRPQRGHRVAHGPSRRP